MADPNQDQNNQQNQGKNKGGGGGGGNTSGMNWGGKLDPAQMNDDTSLGKLVTDQLIVGVTATAAAVIMYSLCKIIRPVFGVKPSAAPQGGGGGAISHPGQIAKALGQLKNHPQMAEFTPKIREALGE